MTGDAAARPKQAARRRVNFMVKNVVEMIMLVLCLLRVEYDWRMKKELNDGNSREDLAATYTQKRRSFSL